MSKVGTINPSTNFRVSIHVLRRGRCVLDDLKLDVTNSMFQSTSSEEDVVSVFPSACIVIWKGFNPRPPKRTLCHLASRTTATGNGFQSTSSEEDVVSHRSLIV